MDKLDVSEFPDGGRATLVRRYSPTLTRRQLDILRFCKYDDSPRVLATNEYRQARELVRRGLLEQDPTSIAVFRTTAAGQTVVNHWESAGWL
jgi:hypothetical protein